MGHTIASLRRAVIAKAFLILSSPRLEASCIGETGINLRGGKEEEKRRRRGKEGIFKAPIFNAMFRYAWTRVTRVGLREKKPFGAILLVSLSFLEPQSLASWLGSLGSSVNSSSLLPITMYSITLQCHGQPGLLFLLHGILFFKHIFNYRLIGDHSYHGESTLLTALGGY